MMSPTNTAVPLLLLHVPNDEPSELLLCKQFRLPFSEPSGQLVSILFSAAAAPPPPPPAVVELVDDDEDDEEEEEECVAAAVAAAAEPTLPPAAATEDRFAVRLEMELDESICCS